MKKILLGIAVIGTVASVVAGREQPAPQVVEPIKRVDTRLAVSEEIDLSKLEARAGEEVKNDAFAARSFSPPAVPAGQAPERQAKREAPPLPFRYVGKLQDGDKLAVFLAHGEESLVVSAGQKIGEYRVDSVTEEEIRFTYLPLKTKQVLPL
jgi:hypothetical protein